MRHVSIVSEHDLQVLDTVRIGVPFAFEGFLHDGRLSLLNLEDTALDGPGYLPQALSDTSLRDKNGPPTMKCVT